MESIDILMATYNGEKYIEEQIQSILNQTYSEFNLIISDDCSEDNTVSLVRGLAASDKRIKLIENLTNVGYIRNFEKLLLASKADYIMFADQDDVWLEDKVEKSFAFLKETKSDLIYTDLKVVDEKLNVLFDSFNREMKIFPKRVKTYNDLFHRNYATGNTILFSANMKKHILPFVELKTYEYIHDWYILIECMYHGKVSYLDEALILYRQHGNNQIGATKEKNKNKRFIDLKNKREKYLKTHLEFIGNLMEKHQEFKEYLSYLESLKNTEWVNFHFLSFYKYFKSELFTAKIKFMIVLHFPVIFCFFSD